MRPHDLESPFDWNQRRLLIQDRVWYAFPDHNNPDDPFVFPGWDHPDVFGNRNPVCLEYCSGNGAWIAEKALANPQLNWVALEMKFSRVRKIWSKIKNHQIPNLFIICGEAYNVTQHYLPKQSISQAFINFPDPWPKTRHIKKRLIQIPFLNQIENVFHKGATLDFVTDDANYSKWTIKLMSAVCEFQSSYPTPYYKTENEGYGSSYFDALWRARGREIYYHRFQTVRVA
ncbi:MAG: tRNA (guanosine(46)-N7)-methyltransferase TrmB [Parachlamydiaceae bacterium]|nr:tRNA (guanosine(46)-N7)-methyltransferase TrmB [Parachlamydiaceae bacterium]